MMCFEGGCGSCLVSAEFIHPVTHKRVHVSVNSVSFNNNCLLGLEY